MQKGCSTTVLLLFDKVIVLLYNYFNSALKEQSRRTDMTAKEKARRAAASVALDGVLKYIKKSPHRMPTS